MATSTNSTGSSSSSSGNTDGRAPPAVLLPFVSAVAVFVVGSLIVKWVWPDK